MIYALARAQIGRGSSARRGWLRFSDPVDTIAADRLNEVRPALDRVEAAVAAGNFAVGMVSYDAGPAFDPAIRSHRDATVPLVHFGIFDPTTVIESEPRNSSYWLGPRRPLISRSNFEEGVRTVHRFIEAGETYQVNLTLRLGARFAGDPEALFAELARAQQGEYEAFLDLGDNVVCSASPELFFTRDAVGNLFSKPMKGTRAAGTPHDELTGSVKDQAENTMIVDMMRNDFGRIATIGSVDVPALHEVEEFPTIIQMTSSVTAHTQVGLADLFTATFPPASITGAPKFRTTEIITELETQPRGIYTGSVGVLSPDRPDHDAERRDEWNVAIRTVWIDRDAGRATYGVGGGIVWDSDPSDEWNETRVKSRVLLSADQRFEVLESLRYDPTDSTLRRDGGFWLLDYHLDRMERTTDFFQFSFDPEEARTRLLEFSAHEPKKVRLLAWQDGGVSLTHEPLSAGGNFDTSPFLSEAAGSEGAIELSLSAAIDSVPVDEGDPFLLHKTTLRRFYSAAEARHPAAQEVILVSSEGLVTESLRANVVIASEAGELITPPAAHALLPGVFRQHLLASGALSERNITVPTLREAGRDGRAWLINSVRGWMQLRLDQD